MKIYLAHIKYDNSNVGGGIKEVGFARKEDAEAVSDVGYVTEIDFYEEIPAKVSHIDIYVEEIGDPYNGTPRESITQEYPWVHHDEEREDPFVSFIQYRTRAQLVVTGTRHEEARQAFQERLDRELAGTTCGKDNLNQ
jgi:hypothetical protein